LGSGRRPIIVSNTSSRLLVPRGLLFRPSCTTKMIVRSLGDPNLTAQLLPQRHARPHRCLLRTTIGRS
jgi:hypothetical protein